MEDPSNRDSTKVKIIRAFTRFTLTVSITIIPCFTPFQENNKKSNAIKFHNSFSFQSLVLSHGLMKILSCHGMLRTRECQYACFELKTYIIICRFRKVKRS